MKKIIIITSLLTLCVSMQAQEIELSSISLSSGEGPLSSGLFFEANLARGNDILNISLGERDMYVYYLKSVTKHLMVGPCFEYYYNIPILGAMATLSPVKNLSFFTWTGVSAGEPGMDVEPLNWRFLFFYQSVSFDVKRFTASYAIMHYEVWRMIVDLKYTQPIRSDLSFFTSAGYNFHEDGRALFKIGLVYKR